MRRRRENLLNQNPHMLHVQSTLNPNANTKKNTCSSQNCAFWNRVGWIHSVSPMFTANQATVTSTSVKSNVSDGEGVGDG